MSRPSLYKRALKAGVWTVGAQGAELGTRLISTLIMTRLLFPEAFGQVAAGTSLVVGLALISDFGIRTIIMQSPRGDQDCFLRSAWTLQAARGLGLWMVLICLCAFISLPAIRKTFPADSVFASPHFFFITAALGFGLVLGGLESTAVHLNARRLNLRPIVVLDLAGRLFSLPVMIVWAWIIPTVWALIGGGIIGGVVRLIMSHVFVPGPRMSFRWSRDDIHEIGRFGKWISVSSTASFISGQSDRLILGLLLSGSVFGLYSIARMLVETLEGLLWRLNSSLTVPVLSEVVRKDYGSFKDKYYRFRLPFELSAALLGGILLSTGSIVVLILFDQRYADAGQMVQILAVGLATYPALFIAGAFTANGEPRVVATMSILQAISLIACLTLGYLIAGMTGGIWGIAIHKFVPSAFILTIARERHWIDIRKELRTLLVFIVGIIAGQGIRMILSAFGIAEVDQFWPLGV